jgi:hypothetical protein
MLNIRQQSCLNYAVVAEANDVIFNVKNYEGDADLYIAPKSTPSGPSDTQSIYMFAGRSA